MAEPFPRAPVNPGAARWTRAVMDRIGGVEDGLARSGQRLLGAERLIAGIKERDTDGAMNYRGPWQSYTTLVPGTAVQGGYVDNFDFTAIPAHNLVIADGTVIPWTSDGDGPGDQDGVTITVACTFVYDVPSDYDQQDNHRYGAKLGFGSTMQYDGDRNVYFSEGGYSQFDRSTQELPSAGHHVVDFTASGTVLANATLGLLIQGFPYKGNGGWTRLSITTQGSTKPKNVWRPGVLGTANTSVRTGIPYSPGDVVLWQTALWIAVADPQGVAPGGDEGVWQVVTPTPTAAHAGGWTP